MSKELSREILNRWTCYDPNSGLQVNGLHHSWEVSLKWKKMSRLDQHPDTRGQRHDKGINPKIDLVNVEKAPLLNAQATLKCGLEGH